MSTHPEELDPQIISDNNLPQNLQQHQHHLQQVQPQQPNDGGGSATPRKPKGPSVRRACIACHTGKTRCSETLPCQNCLKRGLGNVCVYPDPDSEQPVPARIMAPAADPSAPGATPTFVATAPPPPPPVYAASTAGLTLNHQQYYDYNGTFTGASSTTFRPAKRARTLTEEETAAITRNFSRGDFFVGNSAPVRIDPRLPVRLTLGEGDHVHFNVGNYET